MKLKLTYITALILLATSCASEDIGIDKADTLTGADEKTPICVTALLDAGRAAKTRAADKAFANGDQFVAYLRHVTWNGGFTTADADKRTSVTADQAPRLVALTCTGSATLSNTISDIYPFDTTKNVEVNSDNSQQATGVTLSYTNTGGGTSTKLYWDDFSNSVSAGTDLRTAGHYLQSYYGYCYNGGTPSTALTEGTGVIGWTIQTDQSAEVNMQHSDLLWSAEQTPVSYHHGETNADGSRPGLVIPYTHAMSKVTIKVTAGTGFATNFDFTGTGLTLNNVRTTCTATAPTATLDFASSIKANVTMKPGTGTGTRSFEAIIVPTILTVGNTFATITGMDGNTYNIPVTEAIVKATDGWGAQLTDATEDVNHGTAQVKPRKRTDDATVPTGKGHQMKSGVHYVLNVTIGKTEVNVSATILDWEEVEAEGVGEIQFANDIATTGDIVDALRNNDIYIYKSATTTFGTSATILRWNKAKDAWKYNPVIYWQGGAEYFRALTGVRADAAGTAQDESLIMENTQDALWGTTEAKDGYSEGQALQPRTGDVPLQFYHAMSKITFNLVDANKDNADPLARIDLHDATIQLTDLATGGKINLNDGSITLNDISVGQKTFGEDPGAIPARMGYYAAKENGTDTHYDDYTLKDYIITPQTITDAATVIVTLANGAVYKLKLNTCKIQETATPITLWERGKHYTYDIIIEKEKITFRAVIKDWIPETGSGNATLEWD